MLVCILISLHGFEQVFQEAASDLCFFSIIIIISGRNVDKCILKAIYFFFFSLLKMVFPNPSLVFRMCDACQAFEWCVNYKLIEHVFI